LRRSQLGALLRPDKGLEHDFLSAYAKRHVDLPVKKSEKEKEKEINVGV
jgi:hypothetical protein